LVCRGCCCGTSRKHPTVDHDTQVEALRAAAEGQGSVTVVDCLGRCDRSNVVVVKRARQRPLWIGPLLDETSTDALGSWLRAGASDPPPPTVAALVFDRHQVADRAPVGLQLGVRR
jgi:hypothetical protein